MLYGYLPMRCANRWRRSLWLRWHTSERYAQITADALTLASLRGVDTHGATNVVQLYAESILEGTFKSPQEIEVISESDTTALLSCGWGLGHPAAHIGMEMAMDKAAEHGVGMSTIRDGHHIGMVAYYAMLALERDMIGIAMTNAGPAVTSRSGQASDARYQPDSFRSTRR